MNKTSIKSISHIYFVMYFPIIPSNKYYINYFQLYNLINKYYIDYSKFNICHFISMMIIFFTHNDNDKYSSTL